MESQCIFTLKEKVYVSNLVFYRIFSGGGVLFPAIKWDYAVNSSQTVIAQIKSATYKYSSIHCLQGFH